jgi:hypothetical protein
MPKGSFSFLAMDLVKMIKLNQSGKKIKSEGEVLNFRSLRIERSLAGLTKSNKNLNLDAAVDSPPAWAKSVHKAGEGEICLPAPGFSCRLGFRVEEFGSSGSGGADCSMKLLPHVPQGEAGEEIPPSRKPNPIPFPYKFPRDRLDPMEGPPPQDDDPNSSTRNSRRAPFLLQGS